MRRRSFLRSIGCAIAIAAAPVALNRTALALVDSQPLGTTRVRRFRFAGVAGNVSEIGRGEGWSYIRHKLPEAISVLSDEALDVEYEYRVGSTPSMVAITEDGREHFGKLVDEYEGQNRIVDNGVYMVVHAPNPDIEYLHIPDEPIVGRNDSGRLF